MPDAATLGGRVAIVTGGGSGMGAATARLLATHGARVMVLDVSGQQQDTARVIGEAATSQLVDVSRADQLEAAIDATVEEWGRLDILCNSAGIVDPHAVAVADYSMDDFDRILSINLRGTFAAMKYAIPHLQKTGGGSIVNWASLTSFMGFANSPGYGATKGAIVALTHSAAVAYAPDNIRVNAIVRGIIDTPILRKSQQAGFDVKTDERAAAATFRRIAMRRLGTPEEAAQLVLFLASDASSYITGTAIPLDGGFLAG